MTPPSTPRSHSSLTAARAATLWLVWAATGCSTEPSAPPVAWSGAWVGSTQAYTLSLSLTARDRAVAGRAWVAWDYWMNGQLNPVSATPMRVSGQADGTGTGATLRLTLVPDVRPGDFAGVTDTVTMDAVRRADGRLDVAFVPGEPFPGDPAEDTVSRVRQTAALAPLADSLAEGRLTFSGAPPRGGAVRIAGNQLASASPPTARFPYYIVLGAVTPMPRIGLHFAGRPAVGRYTFGRAAQGTEVLMYVTESCVSRACPPTWQPDGAAAGELLVTESTPYRVRGTYRFTAVRAGTAGTPAPDSLRFEGAFDAPCGARDCR